MTLSEHARRNQAAWNRWSSDYFESGRRNWAADEPSWGIWDVPERGLRVLDEVHGKDVLELGCGTAYWSAWRARRGARVVGLDLSERQLENARGFQREFGPEFPLIHASAEDVPLPDASFDLVLSEYGASIWADPYRWIPEAARLLRPQGQVVFLVNGTLLVLCAPDQGPATDCLRRDYFGMHRFEWSGDESVEFHLGYGDWIRLLRANGLEVEDLVELRAPEGADEIRFDMATREWARRWPSEQIWKARRKG